MSKNPTENTPNARQTAGVIARPPVLFASALLLGIVLDRLLPRLVTVFADDRVHWVVATFLIVAGLAIARAGIRDFLSASTPVPTTQPTRALVTTGAHAWTRNPIYVGMFLIYGGLAAAARSPWAFVLVLPLAITMRYGVIAREEAYLERRFGDVYRDYRSRVRRWL